MSEGYILRGGGGGLSPSSAVIHVTAPAGSTITFSKDGVVAKVLDASKSHVNAESPDMADWYYSVSSSNYDTWTVTATKTGEGSASEEVSVTTNRQYDVELSYNLWLIKDGDVKVDFTITTGSTAYITSGTPYAIFGSGANAIRIATIQRDITDYSYLHIVIADEEQSSRGKSWASTNIPSIGVSEGVLTVNQSNNIVGYGPWIKIDRDSSYYVVPGTYSVNVTDQTGIKYISMVVSGGQGYTDGQLHITDFYLER